MKYVIDTSVDIKRYVQDSAKAVRLRNELSAPLMCPFGFLSIVAGFTRWSLGDLRVIKRKPLQPLQVIQTCIRDLRVGKYNLSQVGQSSQMGQSSVRNPTVVERKFSQACQILEVNQPSIRDLRDPDGQRHAQGSHDDESRYVARTASSGALAWEAGFPYKSG